MRSGCIPVTVSQQSDPSNVGHELHCDFWFQWDVETRQRVYLIRRVFVAISTTARRKSAEANQITKYTKPTMT